MLLHPGKMREIPTAGKKPCLDLANCDSEEQIVVPRTSKPCTDQSWRTLMAVEIGQDKVRHSLGGVVEAIDPSLNPTESAAIVAKTDEVSLARGSQDLTYDGPVQGILEHQIYTNLRHQNENESC